MNALELSIVADVEVIAQDFLPLELEGMTVTEDVFCAFMVDDPDGIDNSGRRINELSALLSRSGISIFYLSTRITDLILVKEKRLRTVLPTIRTIFSLSVDSDCDISSSTRGFSSDSDLGSFPGSSFTSTNSFLHTPSSPSRYQSVHYQYPNTNNNSSYSSQQAHGYFGSSFSSSYTRPSTGISIPHARRPSHSNFSRGGLGGPGFFGAAGRQPSDSGNSSLDGVGGGVGIISSSHAQSQAQNIQQRQQQGRQLSLAESSFGDGIGRYFPKRHHGSSIDSADASPNTVPSSISDNSLRMTFMGREREVSRPGPLGSPDHFPPLTPSGSSFPAFGSLQSLGLMQETLQEQGERESKTKEEVRKSCTRSVIDDKLILAGLSPDYQEQWAVTLLKVLFYPEELPGFSSDVKSRFISFTTTDEGTSLIADQELLGHFEEHMLNKSSSETMLRCIQVDLSTFGLDTYGLVYSMSNPLVDHGVNLLCLSTLGTANVLVLDSDLKKSLDILSHSGS
ncbi:GATS protein-like 3 [Mortierella polycephala]|uniref:GATS protein-like 3 n=1 Tax=Mortierella polycephala TaxID=41804 RepID=A0A9P6PZ37_9FUNG|nr:GATS protein-like 3 [Mortierella polycephala]